MTTWKISVRVLVLKIKDTYQKIAKRGKKSKKSCVFVKRGCGRRCRPICVQQRCLVNKEATSDPLNCCQRTSLCINVFTSIAALRSKSLKIDLVSEREPR